MPGAASTLVGVPLLLVLGMSFQTYWRCVDANQDLSQGRPLRGGCGAGGAEGNATAGGAPVPPELWPFVSLIVEVIERSVWGYFITFIICWLFILGALQTMILDYTQFLRWLVQLLTAWPMNLIGVFGVAISLLGAALILEVILRHVIPFKPAPWAAGTTTTADEEVPPPNASPVKADHVSDFPAPPCACECALYA